MDLGKRKSYVYVMCNEDHSFIYIGVTTNLKRRVRQHKNKAFRGYMGRHHYTRLVYFEIFFHILDAIAREKQFKAGTQRNLNKLVESNNPEWLDQVYLLTEILPAATLAEEQRHRQG